MVSQYPPQYPGQWPPPPGGPPYPYGPPPGPVVERPSGLAIASLIMGLLTLPFGWMLGLPAILAIVFGRRAKRDIAVSGGALGGRGMATAGQILGVLAILPYLVILALIIVGALVGASHPATSTSVGLLFR